MITYAQAEAQYRQTMEELLAIYPPFRIPTELYVAASNRLRAVAVAEINGGNLTRSLCSQYGLPPTIADELGYTVGASEQPERRADRYKAFEKWASEHDSEQFTTAQLVEASGFSYQTTLRFIDSNLHFRKIKNGLYECRDEEMRRKQAQ